MVLTASAHQATGAQYFCSLWNGQAYASLTGRTGGLPFDTDRVTLYALLRECRGAEGGLWIMDARHRYPVIVMMSFGRTSGKGDVMTPEEFEIIYPQVIAWIWKTIAAHRSGAKRVSEFGFARLPLYVSAEFLESVSAVIVDRVPVPPLSKIRLAALCRDRDGRSRWNHILGHVFHKTDAGV